jgi:hypothetical protein
VLSSGKGFCVACHGREGCGMTDVDTSMLKGALPTDFTKEEWQAARTDGDMIRFFRFSPSRLALGYIALSVPCSPYCHVRSGMPGA